MELIDTHAHLYGEEYQDDLDEVVARARKQGVRHVFLPNIDGQSVARMLELTRLYPGFFYPMLGLHPTDISDDYSLFLEQMEKMLSDENHPYIGIGEVGLDYYWDDSHKAEQKEVFERQIQMAVAHRLPLMIHCRSAHADLIRMLEPYREIGLRGVFHSFVGTDEEARELLSFKGFVLGINGIVTFKKSPLPDVLLRTVPLERIVLETDAPYLAPVPFRGKRNESAFVCEVARKLSQLYGVPEEDVWQITSATARKLFRL